MLRILKISGIIVACIINLLGHEEYAVKAEEVTIAKKSEYNLAAYVRCSRKSDDKVFGLLSDYLSTVTGYKIKL
jgi:hypothetical protein